MAPSSTSFVYTSIARALSSPKCGSSAQAFAYREMGSRLQGGVPTSPCSSLLGWMAKFVGNSMRCI